MTTIEITPPFRKRYALVFDVETTGLIPKQHGGSIQTISITEYPYIIQFAFVLYDMIDNQVVYMFDNYVKIPELVQISDKITNLTGIYKLMCEIRGLPIIDCLIAFNQAYKVADCIVAHNLEFDQEMIMIEMERNHVDILSQAPHLMTIFQPIHEKVRNLEKYCTMKQGIKICNIITNFGNGRPPRLKWPKLSELYEYLFEGEKVEGLHNAMVDVKVCLRCYLKMRHNYSINPILG